MANTTKAETGGAAKQPLTARVQEYILTLRMEWAKISYPTWKQLVQSTTVVFIFVIAFIAVIALYDFLVGGFFQKLVFHTGV